MYSTHSRANFPIVMCLISHVDVTSAFCFGSGLARVCIKGRMLSRASHFKQRKRWLNRTVHVCSSLKARLGVCNVCSFGNNKGSLCLYKFIESVFGITRLKKSSISYCIRSFVCRYSAVQLFVIFSKLFLGSE